MNANVAALLTAVAIVSGAAMAQDRRPAIPPENAKKLSEIVAAVEQRNDFRYLSEIDWNEEGYYDVVYFTSDKARVEIKVDAVTGENR